MTNPNDEDENSDFEEFVDSFIWYGTVVLGPILAIPVLALQFFGINWSITDVIGGLGILLFLGGIWAYYSKYFWMALIAFIPIAIIFVICMIIYANFLR